MAPKVTVAAPVLATWMGSVPDWPTETSPKARADGVRVNEEGVAEPKRLTNSSGVTESFDISMDAAFAPVDWGAKAAAMVQLEPGTMVAQVLWRVKSGVAVTPVMWSVAVPVLARVTICVAEVAPTWVAAKVSELCETAKVASGVVFAGLATAVGMAVPVRMIVSGLEAASLSMTRAPASVVFGAEVAPVASWLIGV